MPATLTPPEKVQRPATGGGGHPPPPIRTRGYGGGGDSGDGFSSGERLKLAVWIGIAAILMFFAAISSAMIVRRVGADWRTIELPDALWVSTALLLASSATFEVAKRQLRRGTLAKLRRWITATAALGLGFLLAQLTGWMQLLDRGVAPEGNPSGSFFYLLTGAHGAHVLGGLCALTYVAWRVWKSDNWSARGSVVEASALYWHFMDALWLCLLALLLVWA